MKTYITLLRGINVGGHRKLPMVELRALLTKAKLKNVSTYIQSGNVVFQSEETDTNVLEKSIQTLIENQFNFKIPVLVKTLVQFETLFNACPFDNDKKDGSYFVLLNRIPNKTLTLEANKKVYLNDEYIILNDCIYLYPKNGYGKSKFNLSYFEKLLNVNATARNFKTLTKLIVIAKEVESQA